MSQRVLLPFLLICLATSVALADDRPDSRFTALADEYVTRTRPMLRQFCLECHSTAKQEGELDLERFATLEVVRRGTNTWLKVAEMLDNGEMPPKDAKQPSAEQRKELRGFVERYLLAEGRARAGDPGPVVLRRVNNAQYTYTLRDLTGVNLDPAREFPADSAAGEGFTNAGAALAMSPALLAKYLDAGKDIARHAVLLPDGFRFSTATTRRDWTNEVLDRIRALYYEHTDSAGGSRVNLQGIVFDTNAGGRLALAPYLRATLAERESLTSGRKSLAAVAAERRLSAKYLGILWKALNDREPSLLLDAVRAQWRTAKLDDAEALAAEIGRWQQALWRFNSVGHIGKVNGPKAWQEPVTPLVPRQEVRLKLPTVEGQNDVTLYLVVGDAGDGNEGDFAVWEQPRLVAPGRADLPLRDVRAASHDLAALRERVFTTTAACLTAAAEAKAAQNPIKMEELAERHGIEPSVLTAWLDYLGIGGQQSVKIDSHFTQKSTSASGYDFVKGWGSSATPNVAANSSDRHVRIPGNMKPHSVAMHPSPTLQVVAGWQSPVAATVRVAATVQHAHPECGNGVTWSLELRRGGTRQQLATGTAQGSKEVAVGPIDDLAVKPGDLVSLLIGPRDGNHSCDLTAVDLTLTEVLPTSAGSAPTGKASDKQASPRQWNLARDISPDVLAGNPHADGFGNQDVWHFYTEPVSGAAGYVLPAGSLLAKWQAAKSAEERARLAQQVQKLLVEGPAAPVVSPSDKQSKQPPKANPDAELYRQLSSPGGPLFSAARKTLGTKAETKQTSNPKAAADGPAWGLDPTLFGTHPSGQAIDASSLCVRAPSVLEVRLPLALAEGCEFVATGTLHTTTGAEGSVQFQVLTTKPAGGAGLLPTTVNESNVGGAWTSNNRRLAYAAPIVVPDGSAARRRIEAALSAFRDIFPAALCYTKIVPVDEVVTLTLFYREDDHLRRLMLDEAQAARLDRLWDELHFVSHDALTLIDAFQQLMEYATQDADPKVFEPLRKPIQDRASAFRQKLMDAEPRHLKTLVEFAAQAYRRPLEEKEKQELRGLYRKLREQDLPHDEAWRLTLARLFVSPAFLYRLEKAPAGEKAGPVSDWELANRLSYFLWSSMPDQELRALAAAGRLREPEVLTAQARRMLKDERIRRLSTEFACQWLHIYDFDQLDEKSERHFPTFKTVRGEMYEEAIRFFTDVFQRDASVLSIYDADYVWVNDKLAEHYGIPRANTPDWRRVNDARKFGRGGILGMGATLAKQSGASRTSPILRGNWVSEVLLGEKLPRPPKDVPRLPDDEAATDGLTVRQLVQKHTSDARCANCHARIDPLGFALEGFDPIGRRREKDLGNRPIDVRAKLLDGSELAGVDGLRSYLLTTRRDAVIRQFCRKLLGYALGRGVQLSDGPLLEETAKNLAAGGYRFSVAVETIVRSPQFQNIRGRDAPRDDY
jgi:hypothetical protein